MRIRSRAGVAALLGVAALVAGLAVGTGAARAEPVGPFIVGGKPADVGEYPHFVSLQNQRRSGGTLDKHFCGGSLIRSNWVLTAKHCITSPNPDLAPVDIDLFIGNTVLTDLSQGQMHDAAQIVLHPDPNADVALIRLATPSNRLPIELAEGTDAAHHEVGDPATVIGHGDLSFGSFTPVNHLMEVDVPIQSDAVMASLPLNIGKPFNPTMEIGAGPMAGGKDSCQGDSGGPLMVHSPFEGDKLIGVVSRGEGCGLPNKPGIYAQTFDNPIRAWIETTAPRRLYAWVLADQPLVGSYTPVRQRNASAHDSTVTRTGTGRYTVQVTNLGHGIQSGTVHVSAVGNDSHACRVGTWFPSGPDQTVQVACFAADGTAVDAMFSMSYALPVMGGDSGVIAYAWAGRPTTPSYVPDPKWSFNSRSGTNTVTRQSTGVYQVRFGAMALTGGTAVATAQGTVGAEACKVGTFGASGADEVVEVRCFSATGTPADAMFDVTITSNSTVFGTHHARAHLWANQPTTPSYTAPSPWWINSGGAPTIVRTGTGSYQVTLPKQQNSEALVHVTAQGSNANECKPIGWGPFGTDQLVLVRCHTTAGALADTPFVLQYAV
jgi:secreted trypsin-like serine protease